MTSSTLPARPFSLDTVRDAASRFLGLWHRAMFLQPEPYAYQRDQKNPFGQGLLYLAVIGMIVALASILGAGVRYATLPSLDAIKGTVLVHLQALPFLTQDPTVEQQFLRGYNQVWDQFSSFFVGYPTNASSLATLFASIITTPLGLMLGWVVYGALVHLVGRGWNRETSYAELLAPLALASSPHLLYVLNIFPQVNVSSVVVWLWSLVCNIVAIRVAYQTTGPRAAWGAVFPLLVLIAILLILFVLLFGIIVGIGASVMRGAQ